VLLLVRSQKLLSCCCAYYAIEVSSLQRRWTGVSIVQYSEKILLAWSPLCHLSFLSFVIDDLCDDLSDSNSCLSWQPNRCQLYANKC